MVLCTETDVKTAGFLHFFHAASLVGSFLLIKANKNIHIDPFCHVSSIIQPLPSRPLMHKCIPLHRPPVCDLSVIKGAVSRAVHSMTSHPNCRLPNMASSRVPEREVREEPRRAATANLDFSPHKHSLLIIVGRTAHLRQTGHICGDIERGTFASRTRLSHLPQHRSPPLQHSLEKRRRIASCRRVNYRRGVLLFAPVAVFMSFVLSTLLTEDASSGGAPPSASPPLGAV